MRVGCMGIKDNGYFFHPWQETPKNGRKVLENFRTQVIVDKNIS